MRPQERAPQLLHGPDGAASLAWWTDLPLSELGLVNGAAGRMMQHWIDSEAGKRLLAGLRAGDLQGWLPGTPAPPASAGAVVAGDGPAPAGAGAAAAAAGGPAPVPASSAAGGAHTLHGQRTAMDEHNLMRIRRCVGAGQHACGGTGEAAAGWQAQHWEASRGCPASQPAPPPPCTPCPALRSMSEPALRRRIRAIKKPAKLQSFAHVSGSTAGRASRGWLAAGAVRRGGWWAAGCTLPGPPPLPWPAQLSPVTALVNECAPSLPQPPAFLLPWAQELEECGLAELAAEARAALAALGGAQQR